MGVQGHQPELSVSEPVRGQRAAAAGSEARCSEVQGAGWMAGADALVAGRPWGHTAPPQCLVQAPASVSEEPHPG